jgi:hypothetical protein
MTCVCTAFTAASMMPCSTVDGRALHPRALLS